MKQIRALQLIDSLNIGGAEMMAVNIANGLKEKRLKSFLCVTRKEGALKKNLNADVGYLFLNKKKIVDFKAIFKLRKYIFKNNINIIHAHSSSFFLGVLLKLTLPSVKLFWHDHFGFSDMLSQRKRGILKICSLFFNHIFVVNTNLKNWAIQNLWQSNITYLPNFASFSDISSDYTQLKGQEGKRIVCLANLRPQKDHLNLIKAFAKFYLNNRDWTLHLVGLDLNDDYSRSVKNLISELNLQKNIFIYGSKSDIKNILLQSAIGVLSSISEGLPVSLLEYGLAKLPVVCTDVGECNTVIEHKFSGYIVKVKDELELAQYLSKLATSKENRLKFGINLNKNVLEHYSKDIVIQSILNIYKHCLQTLNT
ncbi:MAG: glycosyltransferase family 4 protein [Flavobacteriaceae bacterium]|nr:glycosyltransferase family 4 protein [Flavobacteriaceae bacterium]